MPVLKARELSSERLKPLTQVAQLASGGREKNSNSVMTSRGEKGR